MTEGTITVVGLGTAGREGLSLGAYEAIRERGRILCRTARHPAVDDLRAEGITVESMDHYYDEAVDFDAVYEHVVEELLQRTANNPVLYAVPGHPLMGERTVTRLLERAGQTRVDFLPSPGFLDAVVTSARASVDTHCLVLDAHALSAARLDAAIPTVLYQVHDTYVASEAKIVLMERYPDEWPVVLVREGHPAVTVPLHEIDRHSIDHLTSVYLPPVPDEIRKPTWDDLVAVITRLRAPDGCPWDREQTHQTLKRNLLEEAYEVVEAIEKDDPSKLEEELGDLLMQPIMHGVIAAEEGYFTIDDSIVSITRKLIRRHPHVFGTVDVSGTEEVLTNWEAIKSQEAAHVHRTSALDGVPAPMPALMRAMDISRKAVKVGFEWPDLDAVLDKVLEEIEELREEIRAADTERAAQEIGDLLFALVNVARWLKIDPEESLRRMVERFTMRFQAMEAMALADERHLKSLTPEQWDEYWERAKREKHQVETG